MFYKHSDYGGKRRNGQFLPINLAHARSVPSVPAIPQTPAKGVPSRPVLRPGRLTHLRLSVAAVFGRTGRPEFRQVRRKILSAEIVAHLYARRNLPCAKAR